MVGAGVGAGVAAEVGAALGAALGAGVMAGVMAGLGVAGKTGEKGATRAHRVKVGERIELK